MISVRFEHTDKTIVLSVKGHAGQAPVGHDIVCASASILAMTAAQAVADMHGRGRLKKRPTLRLEAGDAVITCKATKQYREEALHTFEVIQTGYELLAENYPKYVQLTKFGKA